MKLLPLFSLCSLLVLLPHCGGWNNCYKCGPCRPGYERRAEQSPVVESGVAPAATAAVDTDKEHKAAPATALDKEDLADANLDEPAASNN